MKRDHCVLHYGANLLPAIAVNEWRKDAWLFDTLLTSNCMNIVQMYEMNYLERNGFFLFSAYKMCATFLPNVNCLPEQIRIHCI